MGAPLAPHSVYGGLPGEIVELELPEMRYLAIDGAGDPASAFAPRMHALFAVADELQRIVDARMPRGSVAQRSRHPEALFPAPDATYRGPAEAWTWTLLLVEPDDLRAPDLPTAKARAAEREGGGGPALDPSLVAAVRSILLREGRVVQLVHDGPPEGTLGATARLRAHVASHGDVPVGAHHEVYLAPTRTLLRQPVQRRRLTRPATR